MAQPLNLIGRRFGRLIVVKRAESTAEGRTLWLCRCDCGKEKVIRGKHLVNGAIRSCGCLHIEVLREQSLKHGATRGYGKTPEYESWTCMKNRCFNPKRKSFKDYGGRGIRVCARWLNSFENFLADMGRRPGPGYSIDRKNNDGDYEPGNCRWATSEEQNNNRRPRREGKQWTLAS